MSNALEIIEHATAQSIGRNPRFANPVDPDYRHLVLPLAHGQDDFSHLNDLTVHGDGTAAQEVPDHSGWRIEPTAMVGSGCGSGYLICSETGFAP